MQNIHYNIGCVWDIFCNQQIDLYTFYEQFNLLTGRKKSNNPSFVHSWCYRFIFRLNVSKINPDNWNIPQRKRVHNAFRHISNYLLFRSRFSDIHDLMCTIWANLRAKTFLILSSNNSTIFIRQFQRGRETKQALQPSWFADFYHSNKLSSTRSSRDKFVSVGQVTFAKQLVCVWI